MERLSWKDLDGIGFTSPSIDVMFHVSVDIQARLPDCVDLRRGVVSGRLLHRQRRRLRGSCGVSAGIR